MELYHAISDSDVSAQIYKLDNGKFHVSLVSLTDLVDPELGESPAEDFKDAMTIACQYLIDEFDDLEPFKVTLT